MGQATLTVTNNPDVISGDSGSNWTFTSSEGLQLLDIFETPVWVFDIERHCIWWGNQGAVRFWRAASFEDLMARDYSSDSSTVRKRLRQIFDNAPLGQTTLDSWTLYPDGTPVPVNLRYTPVRIGADHRDALLMEAAVSDNAGIDATDQRVVEATRYTSIMISYFTLDGDLLSMNPAATEAFSAGTPAGGPGSPGGPRGQGKAANVRVDVFANRFADPADGRTLLAEIAGGSEPAGEYQISTAAGNRWHRLDIKRGRDPVSGLPVIVVVEEDVSTTKQALLDLEYLNRTLEDKVAERTTALEQARQQAVDANRAKSDFLARMSHDLRTPLNAILGFSDILSTETTQKLAAERFQKYGEHIHGAADSLLSLVNDLLDLSRIEAGQFPIHPETFALRPPVKDTIEIFRASFEARDIALEFEDGPDVTLVSDRRAVSQILTNLLSNGLKYTEPTGRVSISIAASAPPTTALIRVSDTGRGIPPDELSYVFEPYFRGSADVAREINGTGLGLPICKRLAELISADIEIESRLSVGTTVSLLLPTEIKAPI
jgi:signal transduction histidine kinase